MSIVTARGKAAKESMAKKSFTIDFKKVYMRLKDGESVRVRLLSTEDYVEYRSHGSFAHGIYTQPCIKPTGQACAHCEAASSGEEGFDVLRARNRYMFAFADVDEGILRVFDASKGQALGLIDTIEQYAGDIHDVAFMFKRTGSRKDTVYSLNPILKLNAKDREKFDQLADTVVEDSFFEQVLQPRNREQQIKELQTAGFPVTKVFGVTEEEECVPIPPNDDAPDSVF
ncbi:hypothetical protein H1S01_18800 [Heliobacterium chlorum]|uniref:Bacteriophage T4 Gp32 single-stranded DNA-binding domain-containing protein n=1 Tax=Heliobacterium chlorum TaxID=2698 RepID=A0ABR7T8D0_HELCL|nr:hypothetical protein [Heliobacterium chlorum]MBC9786507.1 hypothetical protein [Heliobacterium chlorum]